MLPLSFKEVQQGFHSSYQLGQICMLQNPKCLMGRGGINWNILVVWVWVWVGWARCMLRSKRWVGFKRIQEQKFDIWQRRLGYRVSFDKHLAKPVKLTDRGVTAMLGDAIASTNLDWKILLHKQWMDCWGILPGHSYPMHYGSGNGNREFQKF